MCTRVFCPHTWTISSMVNVCGPSCSSSVSRTGLPPSRGAPWTTVSSRSHSKQSTRSLRTPSVDWSSPTWRYVCICMVCVPEELVLVRRVGLRTYILSVYVCRYVHMCVHTLHVQYTVWLGGWVKAYLA